MRTRNGLGVAAQRANTAGLDGIGNRGFQYLINGLIDGVFEHGFIEYRLHEH